MKSYSSDRFLKGARNYFLADAFSSALGFITVPIFTRLLNPSDYGLFAVYTSSATILSLIISLGLYSSITRRYYEEDNDFDNFLGTIVSLQLVAAVALGSTLWIFRAYLIKIFVLPQTVFYLVLVGCFLKIFIQLGFIFLRTTRDSRTYSIIFITQCIVVSVMGMAWVYNMGSDKYLGKIYAELVVNTGLMIFFVGGFSKVAAFDFKREHIKYALSYSLPVLPHILSGVILAHFDRFIINQLISSYKAGLYSFAYKIGMILNIFHMSLNRSWGPEFFNYLREGSYVIIQNSARKYGRIIFSIAMLLILFSKELVYVIAEKSYWPSSEIIPIVVLGYVFMFLYTLCVNYSLYAKKTGLVSTFTVIAGVFNIVTNYIFIPRFGYVAAAWTTLASYVLLFILHYLNARRLKDIPLMNFKPLFEDLILMIGISIIVLNIPLQNMCSNIFLKMVAFLGFAAIMLKFPGHDSEEL